jgi:hypothetical protein
MKKHVWVYENQIEKKEKQMGYKSAFYRIDHGSHKPLILYTNQTIKTRDPEKFAVLINPPYHVHVLPNKYKSDEIVSTYEKDNYE